MMVLTEEIQELIEGANYFFPRLQISPLLAVLREAKDEFPMSSLTLTFEQIEQLALAEEKNPQVQKALRSVLRRFVAFNGLNLTDVVGRIFRTDFYPRRGRFLAARAEAGKSKGTISNESSILARLRLLTIRTDRVLAARDGEQTHFQKSLIQLRDEAGGILEFSKLTKVPVRRLQGWIDGASPGRGGEREVIKIERALGMPSGQLRDHIPPPAKKPPWSRTGKRTQRAARCTTEYGRRCQLGKRDRYRRLPSQFSEATKQEFIRLIAYKTNILGDGPMPTGKITRSWHMHKLEGRNFSPDDWTRTHLGKWWVPSAGTFFCNCSNFIGWLFRPREKQGAGFGAEQPDTLAWCVEYELVRRFVEWLITERSDGKVSGTVTRLISSICTLLIPKHGFLWLNDEFATRLGYDPGSWKKRCEEAYAKLLRLRVILNKKAVRTRDPFEPIAKLLQLSNPLEAIWDALDRMMADRPLPGGEAEAIWYRNYILLKLTACCPLRARNLQELTWRADGTGSLREDVSGNFRIYIRGQDFKNRDHYARGRDFDYALDPDLTKDLRHYVTAILPRLAKGRTDRVFVGTVNPEKLWADLSQAFHKVTAKYLPQTNGFGIHAMRHVVATSLVKETGAFVAAALVLHDQEDTVRKHYGRFVAADAAHIMRGIWSRRKKRYGS
ncbi:MAG: hypothetical protein IT480_13430 [Gammaproteobacteria bacterium]|nr:hypothetical protein [Gammaproteobacteria bacterium]